MYFVVELNFERRMVRARKNAGIGQVTAKAFGIGLCDAKVVVATQRREVAVLARDSYWPMGLLEAEALELSRLKTETARSATSPEICPPAVSQKDNALVLTDGQQ